MSDSNEKVLTDTPLLDEIVYNCKCMIYDGIILKDTEEADSYETESSMVKSDLYLASIENVSSFGMYKYNEFDLSVIPHITSKEMTQWAANNDLIPKEYRDMLLKNKRASYIESYEEENLYYRTYAGLPPYGERGVLFEEDWIPESLMKHVDLDTPIHLHNEDILIALENCGVLDRALLENPDCKYLRYVGKRKMSVYECRKAQKFAPLYVPECPISDLRKRFQELLETNRTIYLKFYYDEAYSYKSDYYEKFIIIMIILQTFTDMISELPEYIIRKDVFDIRTVQYLFESSGVQFFPEIPMRYQISLVRNLNKLIKYKSSDRCIVDIVGLFGFDNIEIFKYYILKSRKKDENGNYVFEYKENEAGDMVEDVDSSYELKFLKVKIDELADDAIKSQANILSYEEMTRDDEYWLGVMGEESVKRDIMSYEFNMLRTKYMSIKSVYSMQQYSFQMSYFIGLLLNNNIDKSLLLFNVPLMGMSMNISDAFVFMYALAHIYYGTEDKIITEVDDSLKILGFNFEADMSELSSYLWETGVKTFDDMGISGWKNPSNGIFTFNQLMEVYTKNKEIYDHVTHMIATANNKRVYDLYMKIYKSLMLTDINLDYFTIDDEGTVATSYAEYLKYRNGLLYSKYEYYRDLPDDTRNDTIATCIYNISCIIEEYINMDVVPYIFSGLPAASIEAVKTYVMDMIDFFKSFKVTILDMNVIYVFDDKMKCAIFIEDDWILNCIFKKKLVFPYHDRIKRYTSSMSKSDNMSPTDHYYLSRILSRAVNELITPIDTISSIDSDSTIDDKFAIEDKIDCLKYMYTKTDDLSVKRERIRRKNYISCKDTASPRDSYSIRYI